MEHEEVLLQWHCHESTLINCLPKLLDSEILADVTISVGSRNIRAHRLVLASCSSYFLDLFQEMEPLQQPIIILHNINLEDIQAALSFMYKGYCQISRNRLPSLLSVGKLLKIQGLCDMQIPSYQQENAKPSLPDMYSMPQALRQNREILTRLSSENNPSEETSAKMDEKVVPKKSAKESSETCKCFLCGKYLSNQYNLRVHMETHEETYHACLSCPHVSRSRDALRKHISYRHPEECNSRKRKKNEENQSQN